MITTAAIGNVLIGIAGGVLLAFQAYAVKVRLDPAAPQQQTLYRGSSGHPRVLAGPDFERPPDSVIIGTLNRIIFLPPVRSPAPRRRGRPGSPSPGRAAAPRRRDTPRPAE